MNERKVNRSGKKNGEEMGNEISRSIIDFIRRKEEREGTLDEFLLWTILVNH